ncbi:MAG: hypothetical protein B9S33_04875 [Pedosphaera sp. Tous-C6FEB]|nr:MAG: hypothetical protein B9S33_04875 [Pedosphaera sp. Tous-C6FEB]
MTIPKYLFAWLLAGSFSLFLSFNFLSEKFGTEIRAYVLPDGSVVDTDKSLYPASVVIWPAYAFIVGVATVFLRQIELTRPKQLFSGAWLVFALCYLPALIANWTGLAGNELGLTGWHGNTSGWATTKLSAAITFAVVWLSVPFGALLRSAFTKKTAA